MRYGIIGTGWIAEAFIEGARLACGADIAAVYSRAAERGEDFARRNGIAKVYTDINELAAADVDACISQAPMRCIMSSQSSCSRRASTSSARSR